MPTPFTHLLTAQHLLHDPCLPEAARAFLASEKGAFLLGNIAADARVDSGQTREATHFYAYDGPISRETWRVMLERHPSLKTPTTSEQRAFIAGYVAHLSMDEVWTLDMLSPQFGRGEWGSSSHFRFVMLHVLLIHIDERDLSGIERWQTETLREAAPDVWLPFMTDATLCQWRDFIAAQLEPGASQTLAVLGGRVGMIPEELRAILDSPERMRDDLWANIAPETLTQVEQEMYIHARDQLAIYLNEYP
ncbi:MAG: hypothetical protein H7175_05645 [Burkholderiales bacterium]|nr:hypothetical protein [Anaerolineae bacterium]